MHNKYNYYAWSYKIASRRSQIFQPDSRIYVCEGTTSLLKGQISIIVQYYSKTGCSVCTVRLIEDLSHVFGFIGPRPLRANERKTEFIEAHECIYAVN